MGEDLVKVVIWCDDDWGDSMFWLDLNVLTLALGFTDWALDWQQLAWFRQQGLYVYLSVNGVGIMVPSP